MNSSRRWRTNIPYQRWLKRTQIVLEDLPALPRRVDDTEVSLLDREQAFGYTQEDLKFLMTPMAETGQEAVGSMGNDAPIAALSDRPKLSVQLFQAKLRAGHQSTDRFDPRRIGDEPRVADRAASEPVRF